MINTTQSKYITIEYPIIQPYRITEVKPKKKNIKKPPVLQLWLVHRPLSLGPSNLRPALSMGCPKIQQIEDVSDKALSTEVWVYKTMKCMIANILDIGIRYIKSLFSQVTSRYVAFCAVALGGSSYTIKLVDNWWRDYCRPTVPCHPQNWSRLSTSQLTISKNAYAQHDMHILYHTINHNMTKIMQHVIMQHIKMHTQSGYLK